MEGRASGGLPEKGTRAPHARRSRDGLPSPKPNRKSSKNSCASSGRWDASPKDTTVVVSRGRALHNMSPQPPLPLLSPKAIGKAIAHAPPPLLDLSETAPTRQPARASGRRLRPSPPPGCVQGRIPTPPYTTSAGAPPTSGTVMAAGTQGAPGLCAGYRLHHEVRATDPCRCGRLLRPLASEKRARGCLRACGRRGTSNGLPGLCAR